MKKLDKKKQNLLIGLLGVVIFFVAYYMGYQKFTSKNDEIEAELQTRQAYLTELEEYNSNIPIYEKGIQESEESINSLLDRLPNNVAEEDFLVYLTQLNSSVGGDLITVSFTEPVEVSMFDCMIDGSMKTVVGYQTSVSTSGTLTYPQFKNYLQTVYKKTNNITFIDSASVTYNAASAALNASINLSKYYVTYDGGEYEPVEMPKVPFGVADPFATNAKTAK